MNVQQIMEDVMFKLFAQIPQEVFLVHVNLVIMEMGSIVLVLPFDFFISFFFSIDFIFSFLFFFFFKKKKNPFLNLLKTGYKLIDTDECSTNNGGCHSDAICTNTPGSVSCTCKLGFFGDGFSCSGNFFFLYFIYFILYF